MKLVLDCALAAIAIGGVAALLGMLIGIVSGVAVLTHMHICGGKG